MKKWFVLGLVLLVAVSLLVTGCGSKPAPEQKPAANEQAEKPAGEGQAQQGAEQPVLRVGFNAAFPPFESVNDKGEFEGFDVDLAYALGKELGMKVEFVDVAWETIFAGLQSKKYDVIISGVTITEERKKTMNFSDPYFEAGQVIMVRKDYDEIKSEKDLAGKKVGVQISTTADEICTAMQEGKSQFGKIAIKEIKRYDNYPQAFVDLQNGNIDAVVVDVPVALPYVAKHSDKVKLVSEKPFVAEYTGIALRKEDTELLKKINAALKKLKEDGTYQKIYDKWFK
ncbi:MAG: polar amino acid transport system substrate-binding protein [Bacillota bacterium]|nr:polar amino acid transport system substrate-binding protein [Bacillota bacterium]MDK2925315.1 polar amino acid transport system substrate-binding protein [Bacillota bacterium]